MYSYSSIDSMFFRCEVGKKKCLENIRLEDGRNEEFEKFVHKALEKINLDYEAAGAPSSLLQPSF